MEDTKGNGAFAVVAGVAFDDTTLAVARAACRAAAREPRAELHLVHVTAPLPVPPAMIAPPEPDTDGLLAAARERLRGLVADLEVPASVTVTTHARIGHAASEIVDLGRSVGAALIVVGTHGRRGVRRVVMGSVAEEVVRTAPCQVLTVRPLPVSRWTRRLQRRASARAGA